MKELNIKLKHYGRVDFMTQAYCEITDALDEYAGFAGTDYGHYLLKDSDSGDYTIRVPGQTCGLVECDDKGCVTYIHIGDYAFTRSRFPDDIDEILTERFKGILMRPADVLYRLRVPGHGSDVTAKVVQDADTFHFMSDTGEVFTQKQLKGFEFAKQLIPA